MGVLNVTPDSFSDGGSFVDHTAALRGAEQMLAAGAAVIDLGGESTRPGARPVPVDEELRRVLPLLHELLKLGAIVSIDTRKPEVMRACVDAGVHMVNDVGALRAPGALEVVADSDVAVCLMHMQGEPATMQLQPIEASVMTALTTFFTDRLARANALGIEPQRIVIDPGIGFGKSVSQNFAILNAQQALLDLGQPIMVGWSRKSSLGVVTGLSVEQRLIPSVAAALIALERGASVLRVHDVAQTQAAVSVWLASRPTA